MAGSCMRPGHVTTSGICTQVVAVFGIGSGVGVIVGGMIGQFLYNKRRRYMPLFTGTPGPGCLHFCHCSTCTVLASRWRGSGMCPTIST